jgi:hypothetical protein
MPSEAFAWLTRIKAVEREYNTVRLGMDRWSAASPHSRIVIPS